MSPRLGSPRRFGSSWKSEDAVGELRREQASKWITEAEEERSRLRKLRTPGRYTIDPTSSGVLAWEWIMICCLMYVIFVIPAEVAFLSSDEAKFRSERKWLQHCDTMVWVCFCLDFFLQFFLWHHDGQWIRNHAALVRTYLQSWYFVVDFASCVPLNFILRKKSRVSRALRLVKMLRCVKTWRILQNSNTARQVRFAYSSFSVTSLNVMLVMLFFVISAHWLACVWGYVGNTAATIQNSWMADLLMHRNDGSIYSIRNPRIQYMFSLYFVVTTLTTCGFGDIVATNHSERITIILIMIIGGLIWALILGTVNQSITTLDVDKTEYTQTFDKVNWMLKDLGVSKKTCAKARSYMSQNGLLHRRSKYTELFAHLGISLQADICEEVFADKMSVVPYFHALSHDVRLLIFRKFYYILFAPSEDINLPKTLLIIANANGQVGYHGRYHYYGDPLYLDFLTSDNSTPDLAVAIHYTHVLALQREDLLAICEAHPVQTFPILKARVAYAILKLARLIREAPVFSKDYKRGASTDCRRRNLATPGIQKLVAEYSSRSDSPRSAACSPPSSSRRSRPDDSSPSSGGKKKRALVVAAPAFPSAAAKEKGDGDEDVDVASLLREAAQLQSKAHDAVVKPVEDDDTTRALAVENVSLALRTLRRLTTTRQKDPLFDVVNKVLDTLIAPPPPPDDDDDDTRGPSPPQTTKTTRFRGGFDKAKYEAMRSTTASSDQLVGILQEEEDHPEGGRPSGDTQDEDRGSVDSLYSAEDSPPQGGADGLHDDERR
eukprot:CAMPEP_0118909052 /NCGR_PEP_ID=MMETSP1166-20130328/11797_1 /TAXON_ID=1104430 /ORGANISM="Chrysoreinhardia sp, Strain CCMP3193" /LENGTH=775 /DNA_ID=CAMNT_0006848465 /DNA_START=96 /DNA_END=2423 /DNA_ORIENTATION=-